MDGQGRPRGGTFVLSSMEKEMPRTKGQVYR